ncbi:MAG: glutamate dehydrogenase, partial [Woeseia sp.]
MSHSNSQVFGDNDHLNAIFDQLDVAEDVRRRLAQPQQTVQINIPVRMDDGALRFFPSWRIRYDD